mmetsp:Transcript_40213/g.101010  ORF Transcript_40213/g.101010 Transcript_40213/m.101010 type:complete len:98 (-) Transcript_40213:184-477(-)
MLAAAVGGATAGLRSPKVLSGLARNVASRLANNFVAPLPPLSLSRRHFYQATSNSRSFLLETVIVPTLHSTPALLPQAASVHPSACLPALTQLRSRT